MAEKLDPGARRAALSPLAETGWGAVEGREAIRKVFLFRSFSEAWGFMSRVALAAGQQEQTPPVAVTGFVRVQLRRSRVIVESQLVLPDIRQDARSLEVSFRVLRIELNGLIQQIDGLVELLLFDESDGLFNAFGCVGRQFSGRFRTRLLSVVPGRCAGIG